MNIKFIVVGLFIFTAVSGCSNDNLSTYVDEVTDAESVEQVNAVDDDGVDYGMGHYTDESIEDAEEYYGEERGDLISDDFAVNEPINSGENLFHISTFIEEDDSEIKRYYVAQDIGAGGMLPPGLPSMKYRQGISIVSEYDTEVVVDSVVVNKGQSCNLSARLPAYLNYGDKIVGYTSCSPDQLRSLVIGTSFGSFEFNPDS